jgi:hypothetical protein
MIRRRWKWLLVVVLVPLIFWGCERGVTTHWAGETDLEVGIAVRDADSNRPIAGARVEVHSAGAGENQEEEEVALVTNEDGMARNEYPNTRCFGTQSALLFTDTFVVYLPCWRYRVSASGYEPSEWLELDRQLQYQARRVGGRKSRLIIPVMLRRHSGGRDHD